MFKFSAFFIVAAAGAPALASEPIQWSLLGPAVSYHSNKDGAPIKDAVLYNCELPWMPGPVDPATGLPTSIRTPSAYQPPAGPVRSSEIQAAKRAAQAAGQPWQPLYCMPNRVDYVRSWNQLNAAIGVEASFKHGDVVDMAFAEVVKDSYATPGLLAGVGRSWTHLTSWGRFGIGVSAGVWYRTVERPLIKSPIYEWDGEYGNLVIGAPVRRWVPVVLPVVSFDQGWFGLRLSAIPPVKYHGDSSPGVVMLQFAYNLN